MARPVKDGVNYWNKDTDFYSDNKIKLLRSEFGAKGMYLLDYILTEEIYRKNGYYMAFDDDVCFLVSAGAGCGLDVGFIKEFIAGCCRRSFFDEGVLKAFGVLTSRGIQRRYIRMVDKRDEIRMVKEYFLLDINSRQDITENARRKLALFSISSPGNSVFSSDNPVNSSDNSQSKVKESKVKESKENSGGGFAVFDDLPEWKEFLDIRRKKGSLSYKVIDMIRDDLKKYSGGDIDKAVKILRYSIKGGYPLLYPLNGSKGSSVGRKDTSFDLAEYEQLTNVNPTLGGERQ